MSYTVNDYLNDILEYEYEDKIMKEDKIMNGNEINKNIEISNFHEAKLYKVNIDVFATLSEFMEHVIAYIERFLKPSEYNILDSGKNDCFLFITVQY